VLKNVPLGKREGVGGQGGGMAQIMYAQVNK
jgi:hypothetical protein